MGHAKAVTALLPLSNPRPGGGDMLISASLDGNLLLWDPSTTLPKGPEKEITSKLTIKAHADGVLSMALFQPAIETPDAQPLHLCTTGGLLLLEHCLWVLVLQYVLNHVTPGKVFSWLSARCSTSSLLQNV